MRGAVDIASPASAKIVDELLREYVPLFPGAYWHLGADEYQALVGRDPQASFPQLARAARQRYGPRRGVQDLATGWLNDRAAVVRPLGKKPKAWNDGFFRGGVVSADKDIQVEYWTGREIGARPPLEYLREGRTVVNLNDEYLYYVLGQPNRFTYPTGQRIYEQWTPLVLRGTTPVPRAVLGPDPGRPVRRLVRPRRRPDPGPGGGRDPDAAAGDVPEGVGPAEAGAELAGASKNWRGSWAELSGIVLDGSWPGAISSVSGRTECGHSFP